MQINIWSKRKTDDTGEAWYKGGSNIKYGLSKVSRNSLINESDASNSY